MSEEPPTHEGHVVIGDIRTLDAPPEIGVLTLRFVHYPGAQQLILWLPQSGYHGYGDVTVTHNGAVIERAPVRSRLNGSVQILWDTLPWAPGSYLIVITHDDGWRHEAALQSSNPASPRQNPSRQRRSPSPATPSSIATALAK